MKRISEFISRYYIFAACVAWVQVILSFAMVADCIYNVGAIISAFMSIVSVIYLFVWKFGKTPYVKDMLWVALRKQNRTKDYRNECLKISSKAFVISNIFFVIGVVFFTLMWLF